MSDPVTIVGLGAIAAYLGKDGLAKILGPTADYLGEGLRDFTQRRVENIGRIFQSAEKKLGKKANMDGAVPPRVLKIIVNDGSYFEDVVAVDYFGGVLASSKSEMGRDDRGASIAKLIDDLSTYQLRAHYLIYSSIRSLFKEHGYFFRLDDRPKMGIFISSDSFAGAMDFSMHERERSETLVRHTFFGLDDKSLIDQFLYGPKEKLTSVYKDAPSAGIVCYPSAMGAELYLWAFGAGDNEFHYLFSDELDVAIEGIASKFLDVHSITPVI